MNASQTPPSSERRITPRSPYHARAILVLGGKRYEGTPLDLSLGGALFAPRGKLEAEAGQRCVFEVLNANDVPMLVAGGRLAYLREGRAGIQFILLGPSARDGLRRILYLNRALPRTLRRELPGLLRVFETD